MTLQGLGWNTLEDMVVKWNRVFKDYSLDESEAEYSYITQRNSDSSE